LIDDLQRQSSTLSWRVFVQMSGPAKQTPATIDRDSMFSGERSMNDKATRNSFEKVTPRRPDDDAF
jgi:hypothetical protein